MSAADTQARIAAAKHAKRILADAVKYVSRQWGHGWPRLSDSQREALVRAEILSEIDRIPTSLTDAETYRSHVDALAEAAMRWQSTP